MYIVLHLTASYCILLQRTALYCMILHCAAFWHRPTALLEARDYRRAAWKASSSLLRATPGGLWARWLNLQVQVWVPLLGQCFGRSSSTRTSRTEAFRLQIVSHSLRFLPVRRFFARTGHRDIGSTSRAWIRRRGARARRSFRRILAARDCELLRADVAKQGRALQIAVRFGMANMDHIQPCTQGGGG